MADAMGCWTDVMEADADIQRIARKVRTHVQRKMHKEYEIYRTVEYKTQVVSGMNYLIKVYVGGNEFLHLQVYEDLDEAYSLTQCKGRMFGDDPLEPLVAE